jgi:cytoskeletal protein CcmA (bactofilin family)
VYVSIWKKKLEEEEGIVGTETIRRDSREIPRETLQPPPAQPNVDVAEIEAKIVERFGRTQSALGLGTVVQGKLSFDTTVRIDGKLSGDIHSSKAVIVGRSGEIDAQVEVATLIVLGKVRGEIRATERVEIIAGGEVHGSVSTPVLLVQEGSLLDGQVCMSPPKKALPEQTSGSDYRTGRGDTTVIVTDDDAPAGLIERARH